MRRLLAIALLTSTAGPAGAAPAGCETLLQHMPAPDVAYRPGVDAHGRRVVPADLYPQAQVPSEGLVFIGLSVPLSVLRHRRQRPVDGSEVYIGEVAVDLATGHLWFDGRPLSTGDTAALVAWCRGGSGLPPLPAHKPTP